MARQTIDFGIDLGTTNSAISVLNNIKPEIIKNNDDIDITSSAVWIDKNKRMVVGNRAKSRMENPNSVNDVYIEFKREIGSNRVYNFNSSGISKTPIELSAEVLKELKGNVQSKLNEDLQAAVITIPAAFSQAQCSATKQAAILAGFKQCPLLQEPVAASLAYGFQGDVNTRDMWLVFDFGGGTFDAAIMKASEGALQVVSHGGDNYLGGSDIDYGIIENIIIPKIKNEFNLPNFHRGNERWLYAMARMKRMVEEAKIELSRKEIWTLDNCSFEDADGNLIDFEDLNITLTRNDVISVVEPLIVRAADRCRAVLNGAGLNANDMSKVLLVGGPTKAPYFRDILSNELNIPLDFSVDPLTVVSSGAAIFAGAQKLESSAQVTSINLSSSMCSLVLTYDPQGPDNDPLVTGIAKGKNLAGATIEFTNRTTHWTSGKIELNEEGQFRLRLLAAPGFKNFFDITLTTATGSKIQTAPSEIAYTIGMTLDGGQIVTNTISVALADNQIQKIVEKKTPYPFRKSCRDLKTNITCRRGTEDSIEIPVLEGLNGDAGEKADHNRKLGALVITGYQISRDLPIGSDVEVTLKAKEPGMLTAIAYIPMLDEEYSAQIKFDCEAPSINDLKKQLSNQKKIVAASTDTSEEIVDKLNDIESKLSSANDGVVAKQCETLLIEARVALDAAEQASELPRLKKRLSEAVNAVITIATELKDNTYITKANALKNEWAQIAKRDNIKEIQAFDEELNVFAIGMLAAQPEFWIEQLNILRNCQSNMRNPTEANRLFSKGEQYIHQNNINGLRETVQALYELLPPGERNMRGYNGGLTR